jgi:hypothetical protein
VVHVPDDSYSVRIDRSQGIVEITGPDKIWIAEQLERLASVYEAPPTNQSDGAPRPPQSAREQSARTTAAARKKPTRRTRGGGTARRVDENLKAKLTAEIRKKLDAYVKERRVAFDKSKQNQAAIIATFLEDELSTPRIDDSALYTVFHVMGWPWTGRPRATIDNARVRNGYFGGWTDGKVELTHKGANFGRHESVGAANDS